MCSLKKKTTTFTDTLRLCRNNKFSMVDDLFEFVNLYLNIKKYGIFIAIFLFTLLSTIPNILKSKNLQNVIKLNCIQFTFIHEKVITLKISLNNYLCKTDVFI